MTNNTLLTDHQLTALTNDGLAYILIRDDRGNEEVHRYGANELTEIYTAEQIATLASGGVVISKAWAGGGLLKSTNMLGAGRARLEQDA